MYSYLKQLKVCLIFSFLPLSWPFIFSCTKGQLCALLEAGACSFLHLSILASDHNPLPVRCCLNLLVGTKTTYCTFQIASQSHQLFAKWLYLSILKILIANHINNVRNDLTENVILKLRPPSGNLPWLEKWEKTSNTVQWKLLTDWNQYHIITIYWKAMWQQYNNVKGVTEGDKYI